MSPIRIVAIALTAAGTVPLLVRAKRRESKMRWDGTFHGPCP